MPCWHSWMHAVPAADLAELCQRLHHAQTRLQAAHVTAIGQTITADAIHPAPPTPIAWLRHTTTASTPHARPTDPRRELAARPPPHLRTAGQIPTLAHHRATRHRRPPQTPAATLPTVRRNPRRIQIANATDRATSTPSCAPGPATSTRRHSTTTPTPLHPPRRPPSPSLTVGTLRGRLPDLIEPNSPASSQRIPPPAPALSTAPGHQQRHRRRPRTCPPVLVRRRPPRRRPSRRGMT